MPAEPDRYDCATILIFSSSTPVNRSWCNRIPWSTNAHARQPPEVDCRRLGSVAFTHCTTLSSSKSWPLLEGFKCFCKPLHVAQTETMAGCVSDGVEIGRLVMFIGLEGRTSGSCKNGLARGRRHFKRLPSQRDGEGQLLFVSRRDKACERLN